ncbi:transporter substrate-binding domain-containing protein [Peptoniphilus sp. oral taxon 386]|uniref:transporter substrate-binding domain-containing protein n=1 Tax=Peptoniphilus sp. oral taxon 386 TaxID=652713 RepID=UPI00031BCE62|nr:transporter substrate-binding domain-containing protein [Peptoniphilus sp. oral taxon 386]
MKNLKGMTVLLIVMVFLTACGGNATSKTDVQEKENILRVGMECGYPPYNWTQQDDSNGAVEIEGSSEFAGGYDVELAKKVADALGKKLVVVKTEWDGLPPAVQSDKIDMIMAGMSPTAQRAEVIDFTEPYWVSDYVMIVRNDSKYVNATSISDFKDAKVTAQLNTVHYEIIDQIDGVLKQEPMENFTQLRVALQSGVIDAYIGEVPEGKSVEAVMPDFKMVKFEDGNGFVVKDNENRIAAGLKKGNDELKTKANEVFSAITEEERQQIMDMAIKNQPAMN